MSTSRVSIPTRRRTWLVSLIITISLLASACSSGDATTSSNYVPVDDAAPSTGEAASAGPDATGNSALTSGDSSSVSEAGRSVEVNDDVVLTFDSFLALRARAITRQIELDRLEEVATPAAIAQVLTLRNENDVRVSEDSYAALTQLAEWSNITTVDQLDDDRMVFTDCTERQYVTPAGRTVVRFVTNAVTLLHDGETLLVDNVTELQDGVVTLEPDTFGCAPPSFRDRALTTARASVEQATRLVADPADALSRDLPPIFADEARTDLERVLDSLLAQGLSRNADEIVTYDVLGMDVNRPEFTVVVAVCRTYPTGRTFVDSAGNETVTDLAIGSSLEEWLYVQLEPVASGTETADAVVSVQDRGPNCERG